MADVTIQYFDDCPNWRTVERHLRELRARGVEIQIGYEIVDTPEKAERAGFRGSPTVLINGVDPFANPDDPIGLVCRVYRTDEGFAAAPTLRQVEQAIALA